MNKECDSKVSSRNYPDNLQRRDFLQGAAFAVGAFLTSVPALAGTESGPDHSALDPLLEEGITQRDPRYYPPALTGMRGSHPGSFEVAHQLRDEDGWIGSVGKDIGERYDLVVVGGGISGLAAAYSYRKRHPAAKVLVLDNHDDIGGHAKRNEFNVGGKTLIGYGGTQSLYTAYSAEAFSILSEIGVEMRRFEKYWDLGFRKRHGLMSGVFFNKEIFGRDHLVRGHTELPPEEVFANAPLPDEAKKDLARLFTHKIDYLPGMELDQKLHLLSRTSFRDFLLKYAKVHPAVVDYYDSTACEVTGLASDASSALMSIVEGTWFPTYPEFLSPMWNLAEGMALGFVPWDSYGYVCHFPDGNASAARLLARALVPAAMPGKSMEDVVTARANYALMDDPSAPARIRLNSTVVKVQHLGDPQTAQEVEVTYVRAGAKVERVRASGVIMACYNMIIPRIVKTLPEKQKEALQYQVKVPLVYTNVAIRNWQSIKKLGVDQIYCPSSFYYSIVLDFPVSMGDYNYSASPDEPVILHMVTHIPTDRSLPPRDQRRAARMTLYTTPFETFEQRLREQLTRVLGPAGFNASRDIAGITVNRWPHGYADGLNGLDDPEWAPGEAPNIIGRQRFGRIAIANSDAGAEANTGAAIEQALRAVRELS